MEQDRSQGGTLGIRDDSPSAIRGSAALAITPQHILASAQSHAVTDDDENDDVLDDVDMAIPGCQVKARGTLVVEVVELRHGVDQ